MDRYYESTLPEDTNQYQRPTASSTSLATNQGYRDSVSGGSRRSSRTTADSQHLPPERMGSPKQSSEGHDVCPVYGQETRDIITERISADVRPPDIRVEARDTVVRPVRPPSTARSDETRSMMPPPLRPTNPRSKTQSIQPIQPTQATRVGRKTYVEEGFFRANSPESSARSHRYDPSYQDDRYYQPTSYSAREALQHHPNDHHDLHTAPLRRGSPIPKIRSKTPYISTGAHYFEARTPYLGGEYEDQSFRMQLPSLIPPGQRDFMASRGRNSPLYSSENSEAPHSAMSGLSYQGARGTCRSMSPSKRVSIERNVRNQLDRQTRQAGPDFFDPERRQAAMYTRTEPSNRWQPRSRRKDVWRDEHTSLPPKYQPATNPPIPIRDKSSSNYDEYDTRTDIPADRHARHEDYGEIRDTADQPEFYPTPRDYHARFDNQTTHVPTTTYGLSASDPSRRDLNVSEYPRNESRHDRPPPHHGESTASIESVSKQVRFSPDRKPRPTMSEIETTMTPNPWRFKSRCQRTGTIRFFSKDVKWEDALNLFGKIYVETNDQGNF